MPYLLSKQLESSVFNTNTEKTRAQN